MNQNSQRMIQESLRHLAEKEKITEDEVWDEIALAVSFVLKNKNPKVHDFWSKIPCEGVSPTVEEIIDYIILSLNGQSPK